VFSPALPGFVSHGIIERRFPVTPLEEVPTQP